MLYECRHIMLDLARIIAVYPIEGQSTRASDGDRYGVLCSGIRHNIWMIAPDRSPAEAMRLHTDREALIANWRRFKSAQPLGGKVIHEIGGMPLNLLAVSGVSKIHSKQIGLGGMVRAPSDMTYDVYLMGMDEPMTRYVERHGHKDVASLAAERDALIAAWSAVHHRGAA
jgi:hypothetical protein